MHILFILILMIIYTLYTITPQEEHIVAEQWYPCFIRIPPLLFHARRKSVGGYSFEHQGKHIADIDYQNQKIKTYYLNKKKAPQSVTVSYEEFEAIIDHYKNHHSQKSLSRRKCCCLSF